jgi:Predicted integral membrane protein (DUF2269)
VDWPALLLKLAHVLAAFALVTGFAGRWILLTRAARTTDVEAQHLLAEAAAPFERSVQVSSIVVIVLGLATAWAQGYAWLGLTTGWMLLAVLLIVPMIAAVPLVFIPRGRRFEAEMAAARAAGLVTDGLRRAWADPAVALARRYELAATAIIVALMVLKPF